MPIRILSVPKFIFAMSATESLRPLDFLELYMADRTLNNLANFRFLVGAV